MSQERPSWMNDPRYQNIPWVPPAQDGSTGPPDMKHFMTAFGPGTKSRHPCGIRNLNSKHKVMGSVPFVLNNVYRYV